MSTCLLASSFLVPLPGAAAPIEGDHNVDPRVCQGVAGASYAVSEVAARVAPPPFDFIASAAANGSNWALRHCPPQIAAPADLKLDPDEVSAVSSIPGESGSDDPSRSDPNCFASVETITKAGYSNFLGVPYPPSAIEHGLTPWGDLGTPRVYHFNTSADVRILGPRMPDDPGTLRDESLVDHLMTENGALKVPVGRNRLTYRGDTLISILDFGYIPIPKAPTGSPEYQALVKNSPPLRRVAIETFVAVADHGIEFVLDEAIGVNFRHGQVGGSDVFNEDSQDVWVYDRIPPALEANTDLSTLPERVRAVLSYDTARDVYYLEAIHPGGIRSAEATGLLERVLDYHDHCDRPVELRHDGGGRTDLWPAGETIALRWTASDPGPVDPAGGVNSVSLTQRIEVRDSFPPVLLAPPSRVIEVPRGQREVPVELGVPRVFDLADLTPEVGNDAIGDAFGLGLTEVTWTASDGFNGSEAVQLINIKEEGTNTAPIATAQRVDARSSEQIEIVLSGSDADFHPSVDRFDPLSFSIVRKPSNGFFVAPLLPYFIEDVRLEASALRFSDEPWQTDPRDWCDNRGGREPSAWQMGYPYFASWVTVDDEGHTIVYDGGNARCTPGGDLMTSPRFVMFDAEQNIVAHGGAPGEGNRVEDIHWDFDTGRIYVAVTDNHGDDFIQVHDGDLRQIARYNMSRGDSDARVGDPITAAVDSRGILYVASRGRVNAYRATDEVAAEAGDIYLGRVFDNLGFGRMIQSLAIDSNDNVFIGFGTRILKIASGTIDALGRYQSGETVGWLGQCTANKTDRYACDTPNQRSVGFTCTDELCERGRLSDGLPPGAGNEPGQFWDARGIAIDPNDVLYVSDFSNARVQRFTPDGFFAGEAKSSGVGYGFLLGDFGNPDDIEVNSENFYILNRDVNLLHVFETTPITPIDDASASVIYSSNDGFVGSDDFRFRVTDGLDSGEADVAIDVDRNFRPPEIPLSGLSPDPVLSDEDAPVTFTVSGTDPDGAHDVLTVVLVRPPRHGEVTIDGLEVTYTPDPDFFGRDDFAYRVSDGRESSERIGEIGLDVREVEDAPRIEVDAEAVATVGYRLVHRIDVFDPDDAEILAVEVDWGDGETTREGRFESGGIPIPAIEAMNPDGTIRDDVETTGPILSVNPRGEGILIADHVYTSPGTYLAQACVTDRVEIDPETRRKSATSASERRCATTVVEATTSGRLAIAVRGPEDRQVPGGEARFAVTVENAEFELEAGDPRRAELPVVGDSVVGVAVHAELDPHLELRGLASDGGVCTSEGTVAFDCQFVEIPYGGRETLSVDVRLSDAVPGRSVPGLALEATWLDATAPAWGGGTVAVASSGMAPTLTGIEPPSGAPEGATAVTLTGSNFERGARVLFGRYEGERVEVVDSTTLTALTPAQSEGRVDVTVVNPDERRSVLAGAWTYTPTRVAGGAGSGSRSGGGGAAISLLLLLLVGLARSGPSGRRARAHGA